MELRQVTPPGKQLIQSYREDGFTINGLRYTGPVLVLPDRTVGWEFNGPLAEITRDALEPLLIQPPFDLVLLGTGGKLAALPASFLVEARRAGLKLELMATPAACRTYNLLMGENRRVAAALLPASTD